MGKRVLRKARGDLGGVLERVGRGVRSGRPSAWRWNSTLRIARGVCRGGRGECAVRRRDCAPGRCPARRRNAGIEDVPFIADNERRLAGAGMSDGTELRRHCGVGMLRGGGEAARRTRLARASGSGRRRGSDRRAEGPLEGKEREHGGGQRVGGVHAPEGDGGESAERGRAPRRGRWPACRRS